MAVGKDTERNSNGEFLRIISMIYILYYHFSFRVFTNFFALKGNLDDRAVFLVSFNSFIMHHTNVFGMLSGFYGIRASVHGFLNFYLICLFYKLVSNGASLYLNGSWVDSTFHELFSAVFLSELWFVVGYGVVYFFSPLINKGLSSMSKAERYALLFAAAFISIHGEYVGGNKDISYRSGLSVYQIFYLYILGAHLRYAIDDKTMRKLRYCSLVLYLVTAFIHSRLTLSLRNTGKWFWRPYNHNNPLAVLISVFWFCFVMSFNFKSKIINTFAPGAISGYLVQENKFIGYKIIYPHGIKTIKGITKKLDSFYVFSGNTTISILIYVLGFSSVVLVVDLLRRQLMKPFWRFYDYISTLSEPFVTRVTNYLNYEKSND